MPATILKKKPKPKPQAKPKPSPRVILSRGEDVLARRNRDGSVALLRLDDDRFFYALDGIAAELWNLIDGKRDLAAIRRRLVARHRPPRARFERDVEALLRDLRKESLIA